MGQAEGQVLVSGSGLWEGEVLVSRSGLREGEVLVSRSGLWELEGQVVHQCNRACRKDTLKYLYVVWPK